MKSLLLIPFLLLGSLKEPKPSAEYVYICVSKDASKYHFDKYCRGLQRCTHEIERTTKSDAVYRGYSICGYED